MRVKPETGAGSSGLQARLLVATLVLFCAAFMTPRLLSAHFGLLDDGRTVTMARQIQIGELDLSWDTAAGRYRPVYWLMPSLIYSLAGAEPRWFFLANLMALTSTVMLIWWLLRRQGIGIYAAWVAGVLFVVSGPAVEAYYTLSKAEVYQVLFLLGGVAIAETLPDASTRVRRVGILMLSALILFLGYCMKETSLAMLPIALAWWGLEILRSRRSGRGERPARGSILLAGNLLAGGAFLVLRAVQLGPSPWSGDYTYRYAFDLSLLAASATRWAGWWLRDFLYLIPWVLATLALPVGRWAVLSRRGVLEAALWMIGWTAVFLPWPWTDEYHLLPCAVGAAWMAGAMTDLVLANLRQGPGGGRSLAAVLGILSVLGFVATWPNSLTSARVQLAVDEANAETIGFVARELPDGATLLVNLQEPREYFDQIGIHLHELWGRQDIVVKAYRGEQLAELLTGERSVYLLTPRLEGEPYFTVRIGVSEGNARRWNASLEANMMVGARVILETEKSFERLNLEIPALLCPLASGKAFCSEPRQVFERELFCYGWRLYALGN